MSIFSMFLGKKQFLRLDKELQELNYDEIIGGLQEYLREVAAEKDTEDKYKLMRITRATQEAFIAIRKIYEDEIKEDE